MTQNNKQAREQRVCHERREYVFKARIWKSANSKISRNLVTGEETKDPVQAQIQNLKHSFVQRGTNDQQVHE